MSSKEEVIEFYDRFVITEASAVAPDLTDLQRHQHSNRCGGKKGKCAFGFPKPLMPATDILEPLDEDQMETDFVSNAKSDN